MHAAQPPDPPPRRRRQLRGLELVAVALLVTVALPLAGTGAAAQDSGRDPATEAPVLEYYGTESCPFCREMQPFLDRIEEQYPGLVVARYDVSNRANAERWEQEMAARGEPAQGVPTAILGEQVWVGFNEQIGAAIEAAVLAIPGVETPRADGTVAAPTGDEAGGGPSPVAIALGVAVVLAVAVALFAPRRAGATED